MNLSSRLKVGVSLLLLIAGTGTGYWVGLRQASKPSSGLIHSSGRPILYWYDPMKPGQHFNTPGKSPFMDMQLLPKYAEATGLGGRSDVPRAVTIDPAMIQNLGIRTAAVERGLLDRSLTVSAALQFDDRAVAIVQARSSGFVERVYDRAPGDLVKRGAPLVEMLVPDWTGAEQEFLALINTRETELIAAGRDRLKLLGMPEDLVARIEQTGRIDTHFTVRSPLTGVLESLDARTGMALAEGATLARINNLDRVWLEAAVPESQAEDVRAGDSVEATLAAYPGIPFLGRVGTVLPEMNGQTRTLRVRVTLKNRKRAINGILAASFPDWHDDFHRNDGRTACHWEQNSGVSIWTWPMQRAGYSPNMPSATI